MEEFKNEFRDEFLCSVCHESAPAEYTLNVCEKEHLMCFDCLIKYHRSTNTLKCPVCRESMWVFTSLSSKMTRIHQKVVLSTEKSRPSQDAKLLMDLLRIDYLALNSLDLRKFAQYTEEEKKKYEKFVAKTMECEDLKCKTKIYLDLYQQTKRALAKAELDLSTMNLGMLIYSSRRNRSSGGTTTTTTTGNST